MKPSEQPAPNKIKPYRWILTAAALFLFAIYFALNTSKFRPLLDIRPWFLILIAASDCLLIASNGLLTKYLLGPFGKNLPLTETTYIALITSVGNFFAPAGAGLAFRAFYLKRVHKLSYGDYLSVTVGNYLVVLIVNTFLGLLALLLLHSRSGPNYWLLASVFGGTFLLSAALTFLKPVKRWAHWRVGKLTNSVIEGWKKISNHPGLVAKLSGLTILNLLITGVMYWLIVHSINLTTSYAALLLFSILSILSLFVNITPANLGIKEAVYIFSGSVLGFSTSQIILVVLIDRGIFFVMMSMAYLALRARRNFTLSAE